jgi:predicted nucleotide-binding protein
MPMIRDTGNDTELLLSPQLSPDKGIVVIRRQIEAGEKILSGRRIDQAEYRAWESAALNYVHKSFGVNHPNAQNFKEIGRLISAPKNAGPSYWSGVSQRCLIDQLVCLRSYIGELEEELESAQLAKKSSQPKIDLDAPISRKVLIVHGHNETVRESCARFLKRLELRPIILHEKPNAGKSIIEKFQDHADVAFGVVVLTADESGGLKNSKSSGQNSPARQNALFEFGYLLGKLGRSNVCALIESGVELPSDFKGVLFVEIDGEGNWKFNLARKITAAGIDIDLNNAM